MNDWSLLHEPSAQVTPTALDEATTRELRGLPLSDPTRLIKNDARGATFGWSPLGRACEYSPPSSATRESHESE